MKGNLNLNEYNVKLLVKGNQLQYITRPYNLHLHQKQFLSCWPLPVVDFIASYQTLLLLGGQ